MGKILILLMNIFAIALALAFFAVPVIKLKDPALIIVILIGVGCMVYAVYEESRKD